MRAPTSSGCSIGATCVPAGTTRSSDVGDLLGHPLRERARRERVLLAGDDEHRHVDLREVLLGAVVAGGAQHLQEHREVDVGHVLQVGQHVLAPDVVRVDVTGEHRRAEGHLGRNARPDRAYQVRLLVDDAHQLREDRVEDRHPSERLRDLPVAPAQEDDPLHVLGKRRHSSRHTCVPIECPSSTHGGSPTCRRTAMRSRACWAMSIFAGSTGAPLRP